MLTLSAPYGPSMRWPSRRTRSVVPDGAKYTQPGFGTSLASAQWILTPVTSASASIELRLTPDDCRQRIGTGKSGGSPASTLRSGPMPPCAAAIATTSNFMTLLLAHVPRMTERVSARLRPDCKTVRFFSDRDGLRLARGGVECVHDVVVAPREPQPLAVGAHVAHVGASAARHRPRGDHLARREVDDGHAPRPAFPAVDFVRAAIRDVQVLAVAARIQAVRPHAGIDEADLLERVALDHEDAVGVHVGDEEHLAVRRDADVLGHSSLGELQ